MHLSFEILTVYRSSQKYRVRRNVVFGGVCKKNTIDLTQIPPVSPDSGPKFSVWDGEQNSECVAECQNISFSIMAFYSILSLYLYRDMRSCPKGLLFDFEGVSYCVLKVGG